MFNATTFTTPFAAANNAGLEAMMTLSAKAFEGVEKLAALNLQVAKTSLGEIVASAQAVQSAKDPQSLLALQAELLQPAADRAAAYGRQVYDIVTSAKSDLEKLAAAQAAQVQTTVLGLLDNAAKNAPEGSANGVALIRSAIAATNNAFDGLQKASRQATDMAEANLAAVSGSMKSAAKAKRA